MLEAACITNFFNICIKDRNLKASDEIKMLKRCSSYYTTSVKNRMLSLML